MKTIGFIGIGMMGIHMATRLHKADYKLTAYDHDNERTKPLADMGVRVVDSIAECVKEQDIIITMLANDEAVTQVLTDDNGVYRHVEQGTMVVDMSTISPSTSRYLAELAEQKGIVKLDAPVSGSTLHAREGNLVFMVGGEQRAYQSLIDIFEILGKNSIYFGEAGKGSEAKIVKKLYIDTIMQGLVESLVLAEAFSLNRELVFQMIQHSPAASPYAEFIK
ncbi:MULTISPECIES: NAD(P)-dependent oxidoreductase [unclassified Paenibacillus]|uniref:NAD(P)-dependent oxidoreductase n=1 Tax=unclassified Paenibacillus TaxID=185978 RepID=UPI002785852C|nr:MULTISPECIES: NAD(P)-dependent oxidoreductase [unclassified Paenibacillus]MDQ0896819.1 3-hydroxyisobutyrate dehydrogenase [Paenibacillus sp. V4I7]MDQ0917072.1 3-hydroxyisobutyrate dehydrogenase [Paenibacillus sp. V4I5]